MSCEDDDRTVVDSYFGPSGMLGGENEFWQGRKRNDSRIVPQMKTQTSFNELKVSSTISNTEIMLNDSYAPVEHYNYFSSVCDKNGAGTSAEYKSYRQYSEPQSPSHGSVATLPLSCGSVEYDTETVRSSDTFRSANDASSDDMSFAPQNYFNSDYSGIVNVFPMESRNGVVFANTRSRSLGSMGIPKPPPIMSPQSPHHPPGIMQSPIDRRDKKHATNMIPAHGLRQRFNRASSESDLNTRPNDNMRQLNRTTGFRNIGNSDIHSPDQSNADLPLKVLSIDVNLCLQKPENIQGRSILFNFIEYTGAQVVLMNNTGLMDEEQLKVVRNEIKAKFNTESAMWASFYTEQEGGGRGVSVLVLGPLAPRTGWIKSDGNGRYLSASSRIKPGLPVMSFVACDFPTYTTNKFSAWEVALNDFRNLISTETEKGNLIFCGGNISGYIVGNGSYPQVEKSVENMTQVCTFLLHGGVFLNCLQNIPDAPFTISENSVSEMNSFRSLPDDILVTGYSMEDRRQAQQVRAIRAHRFINPLQYGRDPCIVALSISGWPIEAYTICNHSPPRSGGSTGSGRKVPKRSGRPAPNFCSNRDDRKATGSLNNPSTKTDSFRNLIVETPASSLEDLRAWNLKLADALGIVESINHRNYSDATMKYEQLRAVIRSILQSCELLSNRIDTLGFADSKTINVLNKLQNTNSDDMLGSADSILQLCLRQWHTLSEQALKSLNPPSYLRHFS